MAQTTDGQTVIPHKIHYCWFGGSPLPPMVTACIDSWRKALPGWEIVRWNEATFDVRSCVYSYEAYRMGSMAHVADVARIHALLTQGGLYLDTDVELLKPLDITNCAPQGLAAMETPRLVGTGLLLAPAGATWLAVMEEYYRHTHFVNNWGHPDRTPNTRILTERILPALPEADKPLLLPPGTVAAGAADRLGHGDSPDAVAIHHFMASWRKRRTLGGRIRTLVRGLRVRYSEGYRR